PPARHRRRRGGRLRPAALLARPRRAGRRLLLLALPQPDVQLLPRRALDQRGAAARARPDQGLLPLLRAGPTGGYRGAGATIDRVEREDEDIVEKVQQGVRSRFYDRGRYSPRRESGVHHFHRLVAEFLG